MESLLVGTAALRSDGQTHLRVVASMTVAEYLVPGWLHDLRGSNPEIAVSLQMGNSHDVVKLMEQGTPELGFVEGAQPRSDVLHSRIVQADDLAVVVAPSHPWAKRRRPLLAAELVRTPLVIREEGSGTREVFEGALHALGLEAIAAVELGSTTAIKAAVISGAGPAVLSRLAVDADVREGRLTIVQIEDLSLVRSIRVVWRRDRALSSLANQLLRHIGIRT
jgi:DNA-binding transcriptional LysR family regulator